MEAVANKIRQALGRTGRMTILTGAGVSAESGLVTFRGGGGLWEKHRLEDVATPEAYRRNPELVLDFYNQRRRRLLEVEPNPAHQALARLGAALGERLVLITQNVDDLHERAGSEGVLHMHGELLKARCTACQAVLGWSADITLASRCLACGGRMRPHIVWFGEVPFYLDDAIPRALGAEVFLAAGTSGNVYPAAGMVAEAKSRRRLTIEVNLEPSDNTHLFDCRVLGPAGTTLPALVEAIVS